MNYYLFSQVKIALQGYLFLFVHYILSLFVQLMNHDNK